jgi:sulfur-oxidizing protein SoxZ
MSSIKIKLKRQADVTTVRMLIAHPMETGRRQDTATGRQIPAHFINEVKVLHNGDEVVTCALSTAVSKNPYLAFRFKGGKSGDRVTVSWKDNQGRRDEAEAYIE